MSEKEQIKRMLEALFIIAKDFDLIPNGIGWMRRDDFTKEELRNYAKFCLLEIGEWNE